MARTTIDVDDYLLAAASRALGTKTKRATVNEALRQVAAPAARRRELDLLVGGTLADPAILESIRDNAWR